MALADNLIAWWTMNEESGTREDSVGSNDLADQNTVLFGAGKQGNAADYVAASAEGLWTASTADVSFADDDFTYALWCKLDLHTVNHDILSKYDSGGGKREYRLYFDHGQNRFIWRVTSNPSSSGTAVNADELGNVSTGTWYFIVAWHDKTANVIGIQVNNGTADTTAQSLGCNESSSNLGVGIGAALGANYWDGLIDEIGLWGRVLSADDKTALYGSGDGMTYPFIKDPKRMRHYRRKRVTGKVTVYD